MENSKVINKYCKNIMICLIIGSVVGTVSEIGTFYTSDQLFYEAKLYCKEYNNYILNRNSKKIHVDSCSAEDKMSEKNRVKENNSIVNLVNKGYVVCANCKAGIRYDLKEINEIIEDINIDNYDVGILPNKEEYLKSIKATGEWYVNHVATYQTEIETESSLIDFPNGINIKKYVYCFKSYNVAVEQYEEKLNKNLVFASSSEIARANINAFNNYIDNYKKIKFKPFRFLANTAYYEWEDLCNTVDDYDGAGDDCVRFMFSYMNRIKPDFTYHLSKLSKKNWSKIDTKFLIKTDENLCKAMYKLGFDIYDISKVEDVSLQHKVKKIDNNFVLQKGDILLRGGHLHVYFGNGNIGSIEENYGWGRVYRAFPRNYIFRKERIDQNYYFLIDNEGDINKKYTRVYRYMGNRN